MPDIPPPEELEPDQAVEDESAQAEEASREYGGPRGLEPTRYGDWEKNGRCIDF